MFSLIFKILSSMAYISIPLYIINILSNRSPITRYYFRLFLYVLTLSLCSVWGVVVSIGMSILGRRFDINYVVARSFYYLCGTVLGIQIDTEGEHHFNNGPAILVGNHQTMLDILYLGRYVTGS